MLKIRYFFLLLVSSLIFANTSEKDGVYYIKLLRPFDNEMTSRDRILFKGQVVELKSLRIDNVNLELDENGRFFHRKFLPNKNAYNNIVLSGETHSGEKIERIIRIFRVHKEYESERLDAALDSIHAAYQKLGWEQSALGYDQRLFLAGQISRQLKIGGVITEKNLVEFQTQIEIMLQYTEVLKNNNTLLILTPWTGSSIYLKEMTNIIKNTFDQASFGILKNLGILWFNRELSILESYYTRSENKKLNFIKWILNDKHIQDLNKFDTQFKQFVSERFFVDYRKITNQKQRLKKNINVDQNRLKTYKNKQDKGVIESAYYVITGTFSKHRNAETLQSDMKTEGFNAVVVPFEQKSGIILYRVQVGPFNENKDASVTASKLKPLGFDTLIIKS